MVQELVNIYLVHDKDHLINSRLAEVITPLYLTTMHTERPMRRIIIMLVVQVNAPIPFAK